MTSESPNLQRMLNEMLILSTLRRGVRHGYQLALEIEERSGGAFAFSHGTLYPILHHLEKEGLIDGEWESGGSRRRKKEYVITDTGTRYLESRWGEWRELHEHLSDFIVEDPEVCSRAASA